MHYLHKILVYIPDAVSDSDSHDRNDMTVKIRDHAESETESFYEDVYDWRETSTAGRWQNSYPQNVIYAADDVEFFIRELKSCVNDQKVVVEQLMRDLKKDIGTDLEDITKKIWAMKKGYGEDIGKFNVIPYMFYKLASLLYGKYRCDSYFYNTHDYTSRLYDSDIEAVKENPEDWAIVLFDNHN